MSINIYNLTISGRQSANEDEGKSLISYFFYFCNRVDFFPTVWHVELLPYVGLVLLSNYLMLCIFTLAYGQQVPVQIYLQVMLCEGSIPPMILQSWYK